MKVERYQPRKRVNLPMVACGCLSGLGVFAIIGLSIGFLLIPQLPAIALQIAGFTDLGSTDAIFEDVVSTPPILENVQSPPESIIVSAGDYGQQNIATMNGAFDVQMGDVGGSTVIQVRFDENDMLILCQQFSTICTNSDETVRNASFDLRPNGMIVTAEFYIPQASIYQQVGVVMQFSGNQLRVVGVDVNGRLFSAPPDGIGEAVTQVEDTANAILSQMTAQAGMATYTLQSIYADDVSLTMILGG